MLCAAANDSVFSNTRGLGGNISVTLSDGAFDDFSSQVMQGDVSPKKFGFLDNLLRRSPSIKKEKEKSSKSPTSWSIFSKKQNKTEVIEQPQTDEATAKLIEQLELEGRSEEEINLHLSYIHDNRTSVAPPSPSPSPSPSTPPPANGSTNVFAKLLREVQQVFKEEPIEYYYYDENDTQGLTVCISTAPFYGAPPPDMDMSFEELASLEPVYVGSKCINNLPTCIHDGTPLPGEQTTCPVCLCAFEEGESLKSLPCVHFYHKDCIDSWLLVGHACPVCKSLVE